jgi:hypothetical protein
MDLHRLLLTAALLIGLVGQASAADLPKAAAVELQPLAAQVQRVVDALDYLGAPLPEADKLKLKAASGDQAKGVEAIQTVLDPHCLAGVCIRAENRLETLPGPARPELAEQGWRVFLVKVYNVPGLARLELRADSPNAQPMQRRSTSAPAPKVVSTGDVEKRFLDLPLYGSQPLLPELSGLELEYRILQVYCRDAGRKDALLGFGLGRAGRNVAASDPIPYAFESVPAVLVRLGVRDDDGQPVMATFTIRDSQGHVYPAPSRRLAPDFFFHPQIYRRDGETVFLQPGSYTVTYTRGPEYRVLNNQITVPSTATHTEVFQLQRWIHPAARGSFSGDHHIHAAGCSHYESPTEGVMPEDMMRHILGEDLDVGCCLSWGPCW